MSELEEKISEVLSNPEQMAQITRLAQSFMGGSTSDGANAPQGIPPAANTATGGDMAGALGIDAATLARITRAVSASGGDGGKNAALLAALSAYLSAGRKEKLDRAMKLARLARVARFALTDGEGRGK